MRDYFTFIKRANYTKFGFYNMKADEVLNSYGEWCEANLATLQIPAPDGKTARPIKCLPNNVSAIIARENNIEIHAISITLTYEVNV